MNEPPDLRAMRETERNSGELRRIDCSNVILGLSVTGASGVVVALSDELKAEVEFLPAPFNRAMEIVASKIAQGEIVTPTFMADALQDDEYQPENGWRETILGLALGAPSVVDENHRASQIRAALRTHRKIRERCLIADQLEDVVKDIRCGEPDAFERLATVQGDAVERDVAHSIVANPFKYRAPEEIPARRWLHGRHTIRRFISTTIAPGGVGKTALTIGEQLTLVTGRNLLRDAPLTRCKTWYLGLEDPYEEYERRVAAFALLHKLQPTEFSDGFFLNSGRDQEFIIAVEGRDGVQISRPVVSAIIRTIRKNEIALLTVDPFVASHTIAESDNTKIEAVLREWARIADETDCAVELVHHMRKGTGAGQEASADDARGASALVNRARSVRLLTPMTKDEAERGNVDERKRFFKITSGKANLTLHSDFGTWRELVSMSLGNGGDGEHDLVGAVAAWQMPDASSVATVEDIDAIRAKITDGEWRADAQAKTWVGHAIAEVLGLDITDAAAKESVKRAIKVWIADGTLSITERLDARRRPKSFVTASRP